MSSSSLLRLYHFCVSEGHCLHKLEGSQCSLSLKPCDIHTSEAQISSHGEITQAICIWSMKFFIFSWIHSAPLAGPQWNLSLIKEPLRYALLWKSNSLFFSAHANYIMWLNLMLGFVELSSWKHRSMCWAGAPLTEIIKCAVRAWSNRCCIPRQLEFSGENHPQSVCMTKKSACNILKMGILNKTNTEMNATFKPWLCALVCIHWKC